jgi:hypothetical protein
VCKISYQYVNVYIVFVASVKNNFFADVYVRLAVNGLTNSRTGKIADFCLSFAYMSLNLPHGKRFLPYGEKNFSPCGNLYLSRTRTGLGATRQTLYFLTIKMKSKFLKFKILQRIIIKFPAIH